MPNRKVHTGVGTLVGVVAAARGANWTDEQAAMLESIGGGFGGYWGGRVPDLVDPPVSPNHRGIAHGGLAIAALSKVPIEEWKATLRTWATACQSRSLREETDAGRLMWSLCAELLHLLAGALEGFRAGYASHLVLDFPTSRSLPLIA